MASAEVEEPAPVFGEVPVRVMAAGVDPVDVCTRRGQAYDRLLDLPFVNGWDDAMVTAPRALTGALVAAARELFVGDGRARLVRHAGHPDLVLAGVAHRSARGCAPTRQGRGR